MYITITTFLIAYLIGSIPVGLIISKFVFDTDITKKGSGNIGATNITRNFGKKFGLIVFLLDAFKGFSSAYICISLLPVGFGYLAAIGGVLGHCYSVFMRFKGGKAISSNFGMLLCFSPLIAIIGLIIFGLVLKLSRYVSMSSVVSALSMTVLSIFINELWFVLIALCSTTVIIFKHIPNFQRIRLGTEPKLRGNG